MFRAIKNFLTGHKHNFNMTQSSSQHIFRKTSSIDGGSIWGGTRYLGYWETWRTRYDVCACGEKKQTKLEINKVDENSQLHDLLLRLGGYGEGRTGKLWNETLVKESSQKAA